VGVGVNVTDVPAQIVVADAIIFTDGVTVLTTLIVITFEVAVGIVAHGAVDVITQVTMSALAKVALV
jgi:hypothetical protein